VQLLGDETLGLWAALETSMGDSSEFEYAAASCPSVGEALSFFCEHYSVIDQASMLSYRVRRGHAEIVLQQPASSTSRSGIDFALGMLYLSSVRWSERRPAGCEASFAYPKPADLSIYRRVFGPHTRLCFDATQNRLCLKLSDVERPLRHSDPRLHQFMVGSLAALHRRRERDVSIVLATLGHILRELPRGRPNAQRIARRLGMSRRTFSRKLEEKGTSFLRLLHDLRCARALHKLVLESCTVEEVAADLGYLEPSSFQHAFRQWFGLSPSRYRERLERAGGWRKLLRGPSPLAGAEDPAIPAFRA
jgi:AraC-like DNA-binding protein